METKQVDLIAHTTCGLEFEIVDVETGMSLTGRMFWASDEDLDDDEEDEISGFGWVHFRKKIAKRGWTIRDEVYS